ncbi:MAG TPA: peptidoglycan-binding protein, partial [Candidatus Accumulibacter sp.]|nr:peptidoglycan-binding protein [Accumulibacter sp.]
MIRFLFAFLLATLAAVSSAAAQDLELASGAPERHIVVPGDTLWGISGKFLKNPWEWPLIWRMNRAEIRNPHLIYPGDVIVLERHADGKPWLRLESAKLLPRIYAEGIEQGVPPIPPNQIRPFLSEPLIVDKNGLERAARIVALPPDRIFLSSGDRAYVADADPKQRGWQIYRKGQELWDPDNKEVLGYQAYYLGTARCDFPGGDARSEERRVGKES